MNESPHILIVDDDREIRDLLIRVLKRHGFRATAVNDGREMTVALRDWKIDLIILDLMLPGEDGIALCRDLRAQSNIPIIMLTALGEDSDKILGLEIGADDYIQKPCNPRELLARIRAVLRRAGEVAAIEIEQDTIIEFDGWELDLVRHSLKSATSEYVELTTGEFKLLAALASHPGRVLTRYQLMDLVKGRWSRPFERSIDMQISRLRRKLESDPQNPEIIRTVRSGGYLFAPQSMTART